ncbi:MAG: excisionase family DNA-binding protein [Pseudodesulfovibrio sp.]|nr:excisionase family DNA-binding protein [Pseudodesulfovibrio sp.]
MKKKSKSTPAKREKKLPAFYTVTEAAGILCVDRSTVERMIRDKRVSSTKPVHKRLIPQSEVHGLIAGTWAPATPPE